MTKRLKTKGTQVNPNPHTGLTREHYDKVVDIANECDMKISVGFGSSAGRSG